MTPTLSITPDQAEALFSRLAPGPDLGAQEVLLVHVLARFLDEHRPHKIGTGRLEWAQIYWPAK